MIPDAPVKPGKVGKAVIDTFEIDREAALRSLMRDGSRAVLPGTYRRLCVGGVLMMTDTRAEKNDHIAAVKNAKGHCLVTGLGLGMVANAMALKESVESVTVVEIEQDVIDLVMPFMPPKVEAICADALTWTPPKDARYGVVWHDIWATICVDDLPQRTFLKRRFGRRADWQGDWARNVVEAERRKTSLYGWKW